MFILPNHNELLATFQFTQFADIYTVSIPFAAVSTYLCIKTTATTVLSIKINRISNVATMLKEFHVQTHAKF